MVNVVFSPFFLSKGGTKDKMRKILILAVFIKMKV